MTNAASLSTVPYRFSDGDMIYGSGGERWMRGLRHPDRWSTPGQGPTTHTDENIRAILSSSDDWQHCPSAPSVHQPLPGTACADRSTLTSLELRPAAGATLHINRLNTLQSFLGNESGVFRDSRPSLTSREVRVALLGTLARYRTAQISYQRSAGRVYARYAVGGSSIHTHIYVLTAP
ncbi:hypothetical protein ACFVV7_35640 [Streptomyces globisporus]|uniref:hypothetical protein n=1 Tax=Streptomyces globisporus TaxID=1908 RepID=UPI0036D8BBD5